MSQPKRRTWLLQSAPSLTSVLALSAGLLLSPLAQAGEAPAESRFTSATQAKAMSVSHWQAIADDMVRALDTELKDRPFKGVHVRSAEEASVFSAHLAVFMKDSFHKAGRPVFETPQDGVLTVEVRNSFVAHDSKVSMAPEFKWTALTAGVMVLREVALASAPVGLIASALTADLATKLTRSPTRAEVTVSASIVHEGQYLGRQSQVYYVDGLDGDLFGSESFEPEAETTDVRWFRIKSH